MQIHNLNRTMRGTFRGVAISVSMGEMYGAERINTLCNNISIMLKNGVTEARGEHRDYSYEFKAPVMFSDTILEAVEKLRESLLLL